MRFIITERQYRNNILNEAQDDTFSYEEMKSISELHSLVCYCYQHLGDDIGMGSSRCVFQLSDEWVIKVAYNKKGLAQNEEEWKALSSMDSLGIFVKIDEKLSDLENFKWIVSEFVLPAQKEDFQECCGLSWSTVQLFLRKSQEKHRLPDMSWIWKKCNMSDKMYNNLINTNDLCKGLDEYNAKYHHHHADLRRIDAFGMTLRNGKPTMVLLDYGLTNEVFNRLYK